MEDEAIDVARAWDELGARLRAYVARRVPPADVEDLVQGVMVKLLEKRASVSAGSVRAWLFTVTRNAIVEHYRGTKSMIDIDEFGDVPASEGADPSQRTLGELTACLDPMLHALGASDADLLRRIDLHGESQTELAASLSVPLSTLKSRVQRARTKLRAAFDTCCTIELSRDGAPIHMERGSCSPSGNACADEAPRGNAIRPKRA